MVRGDRFESVEDVEILERDDNRDVLHVVFKTGMLSAPREMVCGP
jgi:hypothetical protein